LALTKKVLFTRLSRILHHDLHWLDVTERIQFRVAATVYQCLRGVAPAYLTELCTPVTASASRSCGYRLRSVTTSNLVVLVPHCRLSTSLVNKTFLSRPRPRPRPRLPFFIETKTETKTKTF